MKEETKLKRKHECINELMFLEKHHRENALKLMDQALKDISDMIGELPESKMFDDIEALDAAINDAINGLSGSKGNGPAAGQPGGGTQSGSEAGRKGAYGGEMTGRGQGGQTMGGGNIGQGPGTGRGGGSPGGNTGGDGSSGGVGGDGPGGANAEK